MKFKHQELIKGNKVPLSNNTQKAITLFGKKYNLYRRLSPGEEREEIKVELNQFDERLYQQILEEISEQFDHEETFAIQEAEDSNEQILASLLKAKGSQHIFSKKVLQQAGINCQLNGSRVIIGDYLLMQPTLSFVKEYRIFKRTNATD